ncbi:MAG: hypothetical protein ABI663_24115 [Chryseolinea sp.]
MKQITILFIGCLLMLSSCAPKVSTTLNKKYNATDHNAEVRVFELQDPVPNSAEEIGVLKIGDTGFTTNCSWDVVIGKAKMEARKAGGNAIKIINHTPPSFFGSTCHRITAKILRVSNLDDLPIIASIDSTLLNADYALLHIYRQDGVGVLVSYDLHLDDTVICHVSNKWRKTIKIKKEGSYMLWAKTETKEELPIDISFGHEYYIRCGLTMGVFVGRPSLNIVSNETGKDESQSIKLSKSKKRDTIVTLDDKEIECQITSEDTENFYLTIFKDNKEIKTQMRKDRVKSVQRSEY